MEKNILNILAQHRKQFVTNNSMAKRLNISSSQVDELIKNLINQGFNIVYNPDKGYRIAEPSDVLDKTTITSLLYNLNCLMILKTAILKAI